MSFFPGSSSARSARSSVVQGFRASISTVFRKDKARRTKFTEMAGKLKLETTRTFGFKTFFATEQKIKAPTEYFNPKTIPESELRAQEIRAVAQQAEQNGTLAKLLPTKRDPDQMAACKFNKLFPGESLSIHSVRDMIEMHQVLTENSGGDDSSDVLSNQNFKQPKSLAEPLPPEKSFRHRKAPQCIPF